LWGHGSVFVTRWPSYTPRHWVPILFAFYDTHELRWDYSYPPVKKTEFVLIIWHYYGDKIKEMRLSGTYHTWEKCEMNSKVWSKTPKGTDHLKDLGVDEREILKLVWNTYGMVQLTRLICDRPRDQWLSVLNRVKNLWVP
jgi:hypothetical protein